MFVLRREFYNVSRSDKFRIVPLGDIHIGAAACDERLLDRVVSRIAGDEECYWVGMGDYCEFIPVSDRRRFDASTLAKWVQVQDLGDLAAVQKQRFLDKIKPIAGKCLGLVKGNHEDFIRRYYERDIYAEIVCGVKEMAGLKASDRLALGTYGWIRLMFYRTKQKSTKGGARTIKFNVHHGFVGGRMAGAKALNMQRWLWTHDADVVLFGHSHNQAAQREAVEILDKGGNVITQVRRGVYCGSFLRNGIEGSNTYSETQGYLPMPIGGVEIVLHPGSTGDPVKVVS